MADQYVTCPQCGKKILLSEAFSKEMEGEFEARFKARSEELEVRYQKSISEKDRELTDKLAKQRTSIELQLKEKINADIALERKDLQSQIQEKVKQLQAAQGQELELRKRARELEENHRTSKLEMERRLDEERGKIRQEAEQRISEEVRLRELEKDKQLSDMRRQIEDLKRSAELSSQQSQGEILELELEHVLAEHFRRDRIEPVPKGVRGADIIQRVCDEAGTVCGSIIWESKRTKAWSDGWIQKLKDDQRSAKAELAVIVSTVLPKDIRHVGLYDGVWVTDVQSIAGIAMALRTNLVELAHARNASVSKNDKMEIIYEYLSGKEFKQRVEAIVEAFRSLKEDLDAERRAMEKIWSKREMQINRIVLSTAGMYGDLQGIIGKALPEMTILELPADSGT